LMEALIPFPVPAIWSKDRPRKDISWRPARGRARGAPFFCAQFLSPAQGHDQKGRSSKSMAQTGLGDMRHLKQPTGLIQRI
jgi:hypothetical protein